MFLNQNLIGATVFVINCLLNNIDEYNNTYRKPSE